MYAYQVKFREVNNHHPRAGYGGIRIIDGQNRENYVICGCCGSIFEEGEYKLIEEYDDWNDLSQEILGDD